MSESGLAGFRIDGINWMGEEIKCYAESPSEDST
jgi:hypothetical protein